jgi:phage terminase large subunit-like protein
MTQLYQQGIPVTGYGQGFSALSSPCKRLETMVASGGLRHGGNPVLAWQSDNAVTIEDANQNIRVSKKHSSEKVDGIVALAMAIGVLDTAEAQLEQNYDIFII